MGSSLRAHYSVLGRAMQLVRGPELGQEVLATGKLSLGTGPAIGGAGKEKMAGAIPALGGAGGFEFTRRGGQAIARRLSRAPGLEVSLG